MQRPKDIAFTKDIAELVANDLGVSKDVAMSHIKFMVQYIKNLTKNPEILNIYLPHIGSLYLNWKKVEYDYNYFNTLPKETMNYSWSRQLELNKKRLDSFNNEFPKVDKYIRHKKRFKLTSPHFTKGKTIQELEEWQNQ